MEIIRIVFQSNFNRINKEYIQTFRSITITALMKIKSSRLVLWVMVLNATSNNTTVISWRLVQG